MLMINLILIDFPAYVRYVTAYDCILFSIFRSYIMMILITVQFQ